MAAIKGVAMDVDGVLTDGRVYWGGGGLEIKSFHFADIMGISRAQKAGIVICLISGEDSPLVDRLAAKLKIADVYKGSKDKAESLQDFARARQFRLEEICYIGDDVNDLPALEIAGLSVAPADAQGSVLEKVRLVLRRKGGRGAVRELLEILMAEKSRSEGS